MGPTRCIKCDGMGDTNPKKYALYKKCSVCNGQGSLPRPAQGNSQEKLERDFQKALEVVQVRRLWMECTVCHGTGALRGQKFKEGMEVIVRYRGHDKPATVLEYERTSALRPSIICPKGLPPQYTVSLPNGKNRLVRQNEITAVGTPAPPAEALSENFRRRLVEDNVHAPEIITAGVLLFLYFMMFDRICRLFQGDKSVKYGRS